MKLGSLSIHERTTNYRALALSFVYNFYGIAKVLANGKDKPIRLCSLWTAMALL